MVRVYANGPGDLGSSHAKDLENGTWCPFAQHSAL